MLHLWPRGSFLLPWTFYCTEMCRTSKAANLHVRKAKSVEKLMRDQTNGAENARELIFYIIQHTKLLAKKESWDLI